MLVTIFTLNLANLYLTSSSGTKILAYPITFDSDLRT